VAQQIPIPNSATPVVAAIIYSAHRPGQILISKRPAQLHQGGLWEFPGGKIEASETPYQALVRELTEELGIDVTAAQPFMQLSHSYSDRQVQLDIWTVTAFDGQPSGREGQVCRWVAEKELLSIPSAYRFPEANLPILDKLRRL
jgi:8-oxo-dGTP diphosphatase